jgi:hypothetical protein
VLKKLLKSESGQILPLALICLCFGSLVIPPMLAHMGTGLKAVQTSRASMVGQYCADAGVEHAYGRLLYEDGFIASMTPADPSVEYSIDINDENVLITVTRIAGMGGDWLIMEIDYVMPADHQLELRVVVFDDDHMHFAYDTEAYNAWMQVPTATSETLAYYLHNNPTPPTGDTDAQANLSMDDIQPTADTLYNYDVNYDWRNPKPGRKVEESSGGPDGLELKEYQNWRTAPYDSDTHLQGTVVINMFIAPDGFNFDNDGSFRIYLRDYDPATGTYTEISSADYTVEGGQWTELWQPTAPEGKYQIVADTGKEQVTATASMGFGYLRVLSFIHN